MVPPKISVITICYNAEKEIERTMRSVLNQSFHDLEYVIVDGDSKDGTLRIINQVASDYPTRDVKIISEPDKGIYDAMNKGIHIASGEWLNMMNAGDVFAGDDVLEKVLERNIPKEKNFLYSDAWIQDGEKRYIHYTSIQEGVVLHQAAIYRKSLHDLYGQYLVTKPIIISDYLFFCHVPESQYLKIEDVIIAVFEKGGISSQRWCFNQKLCADVIFGKKTMMHAILKYLFNPLIVAFPESIRIAVKKTFFRP